MAAVTAISTIARHSRHCKIPSIVTTSCISTSLNHSSRKIILVRFSKRFTFPISQYRHYCSSQMSSGSVESGGKIITAPYGSWKSPITSDLVSGSDKRLGGTAVDSFGRLFWLESRPTESGYVKYWFELLIHVKFRKDGWGFVSFDFFFSLINDGCVKVIESF